MIKRESIQKQAVKSARLIFSTLAIASAVGLMTTAAAASILPGERLSGQNRS